MNDLFAASAPSPCEQVAQWHIELNTALVGQPAVSEALLIALLAGGHVLLEGPPGVGKRLAARALAQTWDARYSEVCCGPAVTAGLQPLLGENPAGSVLLVSGLEHACLATQATLREAMPVEEGGSPFILVAGRDAGDMGGVAVLGDALLDRFMLALPMAFPDIEDETRMVREIGLSRHADMLAVAAPQPLFDADGVSALRAHRASIEVSDELVAYAVRLVRSTRYTPQLSRGASPRAAIALVRCAQARALLQGREQALPADIKACAPAVLRHRVHLAVSPRLEGIGLDQVLADALDPVSAPRP